MDRKDSRAARLRGFLQADPANVEIALALAEALLQDGQPSAARDVLLSHPQANDAAVQHRLAQLLIAEGDYTGAYEQLMKLHAQAPDSAAISHDLAFALIGARRLDDASAHLSQALSQDPDHASLRLLRARLAMLRGDLDQAIERLETLAAECADDPQILGVLALALFDAGRHDDVATPAQRALALDNEQHEALLALASIALSAHLADEAGPLFTLALHRHPNSGRALSGFGQCLLLKGELANGELALQRATLAMPDHLGTWHALAWSQLLQGKRDDAEKSYRHAYELDRNFGETHGGLALTAALRGEVEAAEAGIKRAVRLDPQSPTARYAQIVLRQSRGDSASALAALDTLRAQMGVDTGIASDQFAQVLSTLMQRPSSGA